MAVTKSAKKTKTRQKSNGKIAPQDIALDFGQIIEDYRLAFQSRQASLIGRKEVMSGKAKFGIFGDGKEIAQIAMAKAFRKGDFRSGYYRDQTFMFATGMGTIQEFFSQLYAHADVEAEPFSAGRQMNNHFATRSLNPDGSWKNLTEMYNCSADLSPTGSQMPRLVGLAYASAFTARSRNCTSSASFQRMARRSRSVPLATQPAPRVCSGKRSTPSGCCVRL